MTSRPARLDPLLEPFALKHLTLRNRVVSTSHEPAYSVDQPGGQVLLAGRSPRRRDLLGIVDWRVAELQHHKVDLRLGVFAERDEVLAEEPDLVVIATGGLPSRRLRGSGRCPRPPSAPSSSASATRWPAGTSTPPSTTLNGSASPSEHEHRPQHRRSRYRAGVASPACSISMSPFALSIVCTISAWCTRSRSRLRMASTSSLCTSWARRGSFRVA
jgi:hypothetical protein